MSTHIIASHLLIDLSTEEQQLIGGGQARDMEMEMEMKKDRDRYMCSYCYDCRRRR